MATHRVQQPSHNAAPSGQTGEASRYQADGTVAADRLPPAHDGLLQIPEVDEEVNVPLASSAIWDWEAPILDDHDSSWYYEPQGELLTVDRNRNGASNEFTILETVPGSGVTWSPHNPLLVPPTGSQKSGPSLLVSGNTPQALGSKRKAASENALLGPGPKRTFRGMAELDGAPGSQPEDRTPAQGPQRTQSAAEPARRPTHRPPSPHRTLTDPSAPMFLPARKVFPIQIGDKLFRLSGASISSDGEPSDGRCSRHCD